MGRILPDTIRALVAQLGPSAQHMVSAFGIPDYLVAAPIAANWEHYNRFDNQGELVGEAFQQ